MTISAVLIAISSRTETRSINVPNSGEVRPATSDMIVIVSISTMRLGWNSAPSGTAMTL